MLDNQQRILLLIITLTFCSTRPIKLKTKIQDGWFNWFTSSHDTETKDYDDCDFCSDCINCYNIQSNSYENNQVYSHINDETEIIQQYIYTNPDPIWDDVKVIKEWVDYKDTEPHEETIPILTKEDCNGCNLDSLPSEYIDITEINNTDWKDLLNSYIPVKNDNIISIDYTDWRPENYDYSNLFNASVPITNIDYETESILTTLSLSPTTDSLLTAQPLLTKYTMPEVQTFTTGNLIPTDLLESSGYDASGDDGYIYHEQVSSFWSTFFNRKKRDLSNLFTQETDNKLKKHKKNIQLTKPNVLDDLDELETRPLPDVEYYTGYPIKPSDEINGMVENQTLIWRILSSSLDAGAIKSTEESNETKSVNINAFYIFFSIAIICLFIKLIIVQQENKKIKIILEKQVDFTLLNN